MLSVLNKRWLSKGWNAMERENAEPMALVFIERLNEENVPYQLYEDLFSRCVKLRAQRMGQGLSCDDFSVDMMLACWPALRKEIREKEIEARNLLPETAESRCPRCSGTEMEQIYDSDGKCLGVRPGCDHRPLVESEWLFQERKRIEKLGEQPIEIKAFDAVEQVLENKRPGFRPLPETAEEIIVRAYDEVKAEYSRAVGTAREGWYLAATMLIHAQDYVRKNR